MNPIAAAALAGKSKFLQDRRLYRPGGPRADELRF